VKQIPTTDILEISYRTWSGSCASSQPSHEPLSRKQRTSSKRAEAAARQFIVKQLPKSEEIVRKAEEI